MILEINMTKSIYIQIRRKDDDIKLTGEVFFFAYSSIRRKKKGLKDFERVCLGGVKKKKHTTFIDHLLLRPGVNNGLKNGVCGGPAFLKRKKRKKIYEEEFILEKKKSGPLLYVVYNSLHKNTNTYFLFFPKKAQGHTPPPSLPSI